MVFDWNTVRLVSSGPDDDVRTLNENGLIFRRRSLDELDTLLETVADIIVKRLGIAFKPCVRLSDSDFIPIKYFDASRLEVRWQLGLVMIPLIILEEAITLTDATALLLEGLVA